MKTTAKVSYSVRIDGDVFAMSSLRAAKAACAANATGGEVLGSDGSVLRVEPKAGSTIVRQGDNFSGVT